MNVDSNHFGLLLEEIRDQNKAVLEAVGDLQRQVRVLPTMQEDMAELKQDMKIVKAAIVDISKEQRSFDTRLTRLETA